MKGLPGKSDPWTSRVKLSCFSGHLEICPVDMKFKVVLAVSYNGTCMDMFYVNYPYL